MKVYTASHSQPRSNLEVRDQHHAQVAFLLGKEPWYPLNRRLCGSQCCLGCFEEEKIFLALRHLNPLLTRLSLITVLATLPGSEV